MLIRVCSIPDYVFVIIVFSFVFIVMYLFFLFYCIVFFFFFFFQAEDGIRDTSVTGVQTCALPILTCLMRCIQLVGPFALAGVSVLPAQDLSAPAVAPRLDTAQARVIVATLQPRTPAIAQNGHATNRVLIYLDEGVMTRKESGQSTRIEFRRGDVRWRPASGAYIAENIGDHPIRILEIDLKGPPSGHASLTPFDPAAVDPKHYQVEFENEQVRVLRIHYGGHEK